MSRFLFTTKAFKCKVLSINIAFKFLLLTKLFKKNLDKRFFWYYYLHIVKPLKESK